MLIYTNLRHFTFVNLENTCLSKHDSYHPLESLLLLLLSFLPHGPDLDLIPMKPRALAVHAKVELARVPGRSPICEPLRIGLLEGLRHPVIHLFGLVPLVALLLCPEGLELLLGRGLVAVKDPGVESDIPYLQLGTLAPGISICGLTAGLEDPLSAQTEGHRSNLS